METELSQKQTTLDNVGQKTQVLTSDLPSQERDNMENLMASLQTKHNELYGTVAEQCRVLEEKMDQRKEFKEQVGRIEKWLDERENATQPYDKARLLAVQVEKQLEKCKVYFMI